MEFSTLGIFANSYIDKINDMYKDAQILSHAVMPNHVHLIIAVDNTIKRYIRKRKTHTIKKNIDTNEDMRKISQHCGRLSNIVSKYISNRQIIIFQHKYIYKHNILMLFTIRNSI